MILTAAVLWLTCAVAVESKVIAGVVLPHGDFVEAPQLIHGVNGSDDLHRNAIKLAAHIESLSPDVVFLTTPHGIELNDAFVVYRNSNLSGFAMLGEDLHNSSAPLIKETLSVRTHSAIAEEVVNKLGGRGSNVTGMLAFANVLPLQLGWGEIIPLGFLRAALDRNVQVVVMSMPTRRYYHDVEMIPELLQVGQDLYDVLEARSERVVFMVSGDLAHTHQADGPYGYSPTAEPFDLACGKWGATLDSKALLETAAGLVDQAMCCGFTGMVMLHGFLMRAVSEGVDTAAVWTSKLWSNHHPTYYGMMVASFLPAA